MKGYFQHLIHWKELGKNFITRVRGQYRYLRYLRDVIGWMLHHSRQYSLVLPAAIATAELFKYGSIKRKQTEKFSKNLPYFVKQCLHFLIAKNVKTWQWRHYREMKRWRHEDIAMSSFSLYYTWLNNIIILHSKRGWIGFYVR